MKFEAASVAFVYNGILWLVGIVYDAVFAVLYIGVDFYIVVCGIPAVQFFLCGCGPEDCTVEDTAVLETVWKSADIDTAALSEGSDCHLHFLVFLDQDLGSVKCIDVLFAFAEINVSVTVCQDKVISVFFPVVFVFVQVEAVFFFYSKHIVKLEIMSLPLVSCRFADSDETAAVVDKFFYCSDDLLVYPILATALCSVCIAYVDHNIKVFQ